MEKSSEPEGGSPEREIKSPIQKHFDEFFNPEGIKQIKVICNSKEEVIKLVKEFWDAMGYGFGQYIFRELDYLNELTFSDRTTILEEDGKWKIAFNGNGRPLSRKAWQWLKDKGLT